MEDGGCGSAHMWHTNKGGKKKTKKGKKERKKQRVTVKTTYMRHGLFAFTWVLLVELLHLDFAEDLVCAEFALWFVIAAYDIKKCRRSLVYACMLGEKKWK